MAGKTRSTLIVVVIAMALLLAGCWSDPAWLRVLRTDPMADVNLPANLQPAASIIGVSETQGRKTPGNVQPAAISHTFTVSSGEVDEALTTLATDARAAGWTLTRRGSDYTGTKTIEGMSAQIVISGSEDDHQVSVTISTSGP